MVAWAVADMKLGSWAVQQRRPSDRGSGYQKYGMWKHGRVRMVFNHPEWADWLRWV